MLTPQNRFVFWTAVLIVSTAVLMVAAAAVNIEPVVVLSFAAGLPVALIAVRRFPAVFIALIVYVSSLKVRPASTQGLDFTDPTFIAIVLLYSAVFIEFVMTLAGGERLSLEKRFAGQWKPVTAFLLFTAVIMISYLYTPAPYYGSDKVAKFIVLSVVPFLADLALLRDERDFRHFGLAAAILGLLVAGKVLLGIVRPGMIRVQYEAGRVVREQDVTQISPGQLIGMTLLILMFFGLVPQRWYRLAVTLCVPLLIVALLAATARGPVLSFIVVLTAALLAKKMRARLMGSKSMALAVVAITVITFVSALAWLQGTVARTKLETKVGEMQQLLQGSSNPSYTAGKRLEFYQGAIDALVAKPIGGWGLGGWSAYYNHQDTRTYPHNLFMEVAAEQGLLGLIALCIFLSAMTVPLRTIWKSNGDFIFLVPLVFFAFCVALTSGDINGNRALWVWSGVALAAARLISQRELVRSRYKYTNSDPRPTYIDPLLTPISSS